MIIRERAYPRAALIGNPSDGYFGKTIAFTFADFSAEVTLYETPELEIVPNTRDHSLFTSIGHLAEDVRLYGYYGGIRLLKAAIKRFHDFSLERGLPLHGKNFTLRYRSDIPHLVGLGGSSAIITACMRALMRFYGVTIEAPELANLILAVENRELSLSAGLQDRVAQVYQGVVYMDFDRSLMEQRGYGEYEHLSSALLPRLYVAYRTDLSESSEVVHNDLRLRFSRGEPDVVQAMQEWAAMTDAARRCLIEGRRGELAGLMNRNFDLRCRLCRISRGNLRMVETARSTGASAKFTGSGGAIVGTVADDGMFSRLSRALGEINVRALQPDVIE